MKATGGPRAVIAVHHRSDLSAFDPEAALTPAERTALVRLLENLNAAVADHDGSIVKLRKDR